MTCGNGEKQTSSVGNRQIMLSSRTGGMDFKVEGLWNTGPWCNGWPTRKIFPGPPVSPALMRF